MSMNYLPIAINIATANIVIIGGGKVASHKAQILSRFTDRATVIAPEISEDLKKLPFKIIEKEFEPNDLIGVDYLFICTGNHELNHQIKILASEKKILTSVCDDPKQCDFISPAIYRQENITISCGSDSKDVKRSIRIRNRIKELIEQGILDIS